MAEHKFPTEVIDLPSQGKLYPKDSPLAEGKLELKYMTTREEDILMSENLIKKGVVIDKLLDSLIVTPNVKQTDLILGDKNAVLVAARILAYGPEYTTEINNPNDVNNSFEFTTPVGKNKLKFKILTGADEALMNKDIEQSKKYGYETTISTRLRYSVIEVDGDNKLETITSFTQNMLARDSIALRNQILKVSPDIDMTSEIEIGGETVSVSIPLSVEFFWPSSIE